MHGSRWQGVETRTVCPKRHSLTLPADRAGRVTHGGLGMVRRLRSFRLFRCAARRLTLTLGRLFSYHLYLHESILNHKANVEEKA